MAAGAGLVQHLLSLLRTKVELVRSLVEDEEVKEQVEHTVQAGLNLTARLVEAKLALLQSVSNAQGAARSTYIM